jgi:hypothetical protein
LLSIACSNSYVTVIILDIIRRLVFYVKCNVSETGSCLSLGGTYSVSGQETGTISAQLHKYHLKTETESSLQNVVFYLKDRTIYNVQNCDSYVIIPSSQTYR